MNPGDPRLTRRGSPLRFQAMKEPERKAQPLGKLLHLRLTDEAPEIPTDTPRTSPIVSLIAFVGCLIVVAVLLAWILT